MMSVDVVSLVLNQSFNPAEFQMGNAQRDYSASKHAVRTFFYCALVICTTLTSFLLISVTNYLFTYLYHLPIFDSKKCVTYEVVQGCRG